MVCGYRSKILEAERMETMSEFLFAGGNTSFQAREWAAKEGLDVRAPKPNELFVDIDNAASAKEFERNYDIIDRLFCITGIERAPSRNKAEGEHVVVTLHVAVTPIERALAQAILGSDLRREGHTFARMQEGDPEPTLFFEKR